LAHSQAAGLIATGNILEKPKQFEIQNFIAQQHWIAITLILCLISEIEAHFNFGLRSQISYVWNFFQKYSNYAFEGYDLRYRKLLTEASLV